MGLQEPPYTPQPYTPPISSISEGATVDWGCSAPIPVLAVPTGPSHSPSSSSYSPDATAPSGNSTSTSSPSYNPALSSSSYVFGPAGGGGGGGRQGAEVGRDSLDYLLDCLPATTATQASCPLEAAIVASSTTSSSVLDGAEAAWADHWKSISARAATAGLASGASALSTASPTTAPHAARKRDPPPLPLPPAAFAASPIAPATPPTAAATPAPAAPGAAFLSHAALALATSTLLPCGQLEDLLSEALLDQTAEALLEDDPKNFRIGKGG